jgi:hypothetical protein
MNPIEKTCLLCAGGIITYVNVRKYAELAERDRLITTMTNDEAWDLCLERKICPYCILPS